VKASESQRVRERERTTGGRGAGGWHIKGRVRGWAIPCNAAQSRLEGNAFSSLVFMKPFNMPFIKRFHSSVKASLQVDFFLASFLYFVKCFEEKLLNNPVLFKYINVFSIENLQIFFN
jgi:hypothetical protein